MVVGASECGISAIEHLLYYPGYYFTSIVLVSPGEPTVSEVGSPLRQRSLSKIGLAARVRIINAELTTLDRDARIVGLSNGDEVSYDFLLITAGLQVCSAATKAILRCNTATNGRSTCFLFAGAVTQQASENVMSICAGIAF